jgi:transposase
MSESIPVSSEVPSRPSSRAAARQAWVERLARFPASGLDAAAFCAHEGVSLASFYAWRRRLAPADPTHQPSAGPRLLSVRVASPPVALELVLPCGATVRLLPDSDLTLVRALVNALGGSA